MTVIEALILSVVEGLTEFLPVSSTGHLILAAGLLQIQQTEFVKSFEIIIQMGAMVAVIAIYWRRLTGDGRIWKPVIAAFIPTGVIGFLLYKSVKHVLMGNAGITVAMLFAGGIVLILLERRFPDREAKSTIETLSVPRAAIIGVFQALAIVPGVSRSAASIIGGMVAGLGRAAAVEFSFFLAVPTIFAATAWDMLKSTPTFSQSEWGLLAVGFAGSMVTAFVVIRFFIGFVQRHTLVSFGVYRIIASVLFWVFVLR